MQLGHFLASVATFISGVVIAIISCWEVSLLTLLVGPLVMAIGATYTNRMTVISSIKMGYQSEATSLIQQVRDVHSITIYIEREHYQNFQY